MEKNRTEPKAALRDHVREVLKHMSQGQRAKCSTEICALLMQQEVWQTARSISFFAPMPDEPDIWPLLQDALRIGKTVALPRFDAEESVYSICRIASELDVETGKFRIREPRAHCTRIPLNRLDLMLVPGVAFDLDGCRLGRGRGFYDRLLAAVRGTKCGVAFDEQLVEAIPVGPLDVRLNCIITPTRWMET